MDAKKKNIIIGVAIGVVAVVLAVIVCLGIFRGFDAKSHVASVLNQHFKGDVKTVVKMHENMTEAQAIAEYEATAEAFVNNVVASGLTLDEEQKKQCVAVAKKMLANMKYEVQEAEKVSDDEYRVPVKYQTSDVIAKLSALAEQENARLNEKMENGEFRGNSEEITQQMRQEFASNLPSMMEEAYKTMEYGKEQTVVLTVKKNANGVFGMDPQQVNDFVAKIIGVNEKQD